MFLCKIIFREKVCNESTTNREGIKNNKLSLSSKWLKNEIPEQVGWVFFKSAFEDLKYTWCLIWKKYHISGVATNELM